MNAIYQQLLDYCGCVEVKETDVNEMIDIISLATGWLVNPCETFLNSDRKEVIDLPNCADCPIEFKPYYHPFDPESFTFKLVAIKELDEDITPVTDFKYLESEGIFRLNPGLPSCKCAGRECGCPTKYKLIIEYTAGYEQIPDCILPVFCNLLEVIKAKNDCDCEDCGCENNYGEADQQPYVKYKSGDVVSVYLDNDIGKILVAQYLNQLGSIKLTRPHSPLWGVFV